MTPAELRVFRELIAVLDDRMSSAGHPFALVLREHRGTCPPYECSARCKAYRELFTEAVEIEKRASAEHDPEQLALGLGEVR